MKIAKGVKNRIKRALRTAEAGIWHAGVRLEMRRVSGEDVYRRRIDAMHRRLGIPADYAARGLSFHREAAKLVPVPCGLNGKPRLMTPVTRSCLLAMLDAARADGIALPVRWSFRSVDDQVAMIRKQLRYGKRIDEILEWIAAPGFSEHHTGRALDFETPAEYSRFDKAPAFAWLGENAAAFQFRMSYPQGNAQGIIYEPWHWFCHAEEA